MVEILSRSKFVPFDAKIFGHEDGKRVPKTSGLTDRDILSIHEHLTDFGLIEPGQRLPILLRPEFHDHKGNPSDSEYYLQGRVFVSNKSESSQPVFYDIYVAQGVENAESSRHSHTGITEEHYFCIRGKAKVNFSGVKFELNRNDTLFIPPGIKHQAIVEEQDTVLLIVMVNPTEKIQESHQTD